MLNKNVYKKNTFGNFLIFNLCFFCISFSVNASLIETAANGYLKSFMTIDKEKSSVSKNITAKKKDFDLRDNAVVPLDKYTERQILFNLISQSNGIGNDSKAFSENQILNKYAVYDLNILCGNGSALHCNLVHLINRCQTVIGEVVLATMIINPFNTASKIIERQKAILYLITSQNERTKSIEENLSKYKKIENNMLSLYTDTDPLFTKEYMLYLTDKFYGGKCSKNAGWLQFRKVVVNDLWGYVYNFVWPVTMPLIYSCFAQKKNLDSGIYSSPDTSSDSSVFSKLKISNISWRKNLWLSWIPIYGTVRKFNFTKNQDRISVHFNSSHKAASVSSALLHCLPSIAGDVAHFSSMYRGVCTYRDYSTVIRNVANRLGDLQVLVRAAKQISEIIAADSELNNLFGKDFVEIRKFFEKSDDKSDVGMLIKYLLDLPYKNWSYVLNNAGKLLASFTLFLENKNFISDLLYEIGKLDALFGIAKLVKENQSNPENCYSIPTILDTVDDSPFFEMTAMWHPFMNPREAVTNDIVFDRNTKVAILTGPNAGGKSTFLTGVTLNIILCQTFGIAAAKNIKLKPFSKINTYINVVDDLIEGNSLFVAEVKRVQDFLSIIKSLKKNEFAFTIFDEPFSGTNPLEGAAAEYSILESISGYHRSATIVATHYPIIMRLERNLPNKGFKNYKVVIEDDAENLKYTFKVLPGESTQTVALRILKENGFDFSLLNRANDIIKNPQNY